MQYYICGNRHIGLHHAEENSVNYFVLPSLNSHPMRYSVFTLSNQSIVWKTPLVSVAESVHLEAKENFLNETFWRQKKFSARSNGNDAEVLRLYENSGMIFGSSVL